MKNGHRLVSRVLAFAAVLVGSSVIAGQSVENDIDKVTTQITRLEGRWLNAIQTADIASLNEILADDFIRPAPAAGEFITKAQFLAYYRSHKPGLSPAANASRISPSRITAVQRLREVWSSTETRTVAFSHGISSQMSL